VGVEREGERGREGEMGESDETKLSTRRRRLSEHCE